MARSDLETKLASKCSEAMFEYSNAAVAAYGHALTQFFAQWSQAMAPLMEQGEAKPKSWFQHPDGEVAKRGRATGGARRSSSGLPTPMPDWTAMMWPMQAFSFAASMMAPPTVCNPRAVNANPWLANSLNPFAVNWPFPMFGASAYVWPMAMSMIAAGWPQAVAVPTAKGNAAALDAIESASKLADDAFSSYQSDSGFATAQVYSKPTRHRAAKTAVGPVPLLWPWVS